MNKNCYRIIFNKARGLLMAVSETAVGQGKSKSETRSVDGQKKRATIFSSAAHEGKISSLLCGAGTLLWAISFQVNAQIAVDQSAPKTQQPTLLNAANGVTQVNIQSPSAAGVSRNTYSQFDVQQQGVILNNSRNNTQSQLGGWVQGNPWLAAGSARVILNEVNSSNPSQLKGYIEVAGDRAQVVIANPSGVTCDGCGFINANRATLTTGTPILNGGALEGYRVQGGVIAISGSGLNSSQADFTDLIARSVQVNAGIWAQNLKVTAGSNQVNADNTVATPQAGSGSAPVFAIDVAQLGGMYAGKIVLMGTESGVGVRNSGQIGASAGEIVVTAQGRLENIGNITATSATSINVRDDLVNSGTIYAQGTLSIQSGTLTNDAALIQSVGAMTINTNGNALTNSNSGSTKGIFSNDSLSLSVGNLSNQQGFIGSQKDLTVTAQSIDNSVGGYIGSGANLTLTATGFDNQSGYVQVAGLGHIDLGQGVFDNTQGLARFGDSLTLQAKKLINVNTQGVDQGIEASSLSFTLSQLDNTSGAIRTNQALDMTISEALKNDAGVVSTGTHMSIIDAHPLAKTLSITNNQGLLIAGSELSIDSASLGGNGSVLSQGDIAIQLTADYTHIGQLQATGNLSFQTTGKLTNQASLLAGNTLTIRAQDIDNASQGEFSGQNTFLNITNQLTNRGLVDGVDTRIDASSINNIGTGRIYGDHLSIAGDSLMNDVENSTAAVIAARDRLDIGARSLTNREHALIFSVGDMAIGASLDANRQATGQSDILNNNSATVEAQGNLFLSVKQINNTNEHFSTSDVALPSQYIQEYQLSGSGTRWASNQVTVQPDSGESTVTLITPGGSDSNFYRYDYTRSTTESQVTQSDPGQILAGAGMSITADSLFNNNSRIIAGGALNGVIGTLTNTEVTGQKITTDSGSVSYFHYVHHSKGKRTEGQDVSGYYPAPVVETITLSPTVYAANTVPTGTGTQIATLSNRVLSQTPTSATAASITLPTSSLYHINPSPGSSYLIESDARFTNYRSWLSSDYMLSALSIDPATVQKRLGDGFYEQKILREQVVELTGRRFLTGYADDESEYRALLNQGVTFAQTHQLVPGVALSADQIAQLTSDIVWLVEKDVTLPDGTTTRALVPQLYVRLQEGDLSPNGALIAGDSVNLQMTGDLANAGTIAGRSIVQLSADNLKNLGGQISGRGISLTALNDLSNIGGQIRAQDTLLAQAGRNLTVESTTLDSVSSQGSRTQIDRIAGLYVSSSNGTLIASAGQDLTLAAGIVQSQGDAQLQANRNLTLGTVTTRSDNRIEWNSDNYLQESQLTTQGSQLSSAGKLTLLAGNDLSAQAATAQAGGALIAQAGNNLTITAGNQTQTLDEAHQHTESGFFSSTTRSLRNSLDQTTALGSSFEGATVSLAAGQDIQVKGSNVVSDTGTMLSAGNNLAIEAATNTRNSTHFESVKDSGLFSGGGFGVTFGTRSQSTDTQGQGTSAASGTVGSISGDVTLLAGNNYRQMGSDIVAPQGNVAIQAKTIDILAARETQIQKIQTKFSQSGLTLSISSPIISAIQTGQQMAQAANQTSDGRMQALAVAAAGLNLYNNAKGIQDSATALANGKPLDAFSVNLSIGSSKSSSTSTSQSNNAKSSTVQAGNDLSIRATDGDLSAVGSQLQAGNNVLLAATNNLNLLAAANTSSQQNSSSGSSSSVGVSYSTQSGFGITLAASQNKGNGDGQDATYTDTTVNAGNGAVLVSGQDTTLKGAQVSAKQIIADVGKNLSIESLQDSSSYKSNSSNSGFNLSIPITGTNLSGSVSAGQSKIDSNYQSVNQQSGLQAGDNGFQVKVGGNTDLKGAVIASTDKAVTDNKNSFQTDGSLILRDLQNQASYKGNAIGLTLGAGTNTSNDGKLAPQGTSVGIGQAEGNTSSTTQSGISGIAGNTAIRTGDSANGIQRIFDAEKVQKDINAQVAITQAFWREAPKAAATFAEQQAANLRKQAGEAADAKDPDKATALKAEAAKWDEGGAYRIALHTTIGALGGGIDGALGASTVAAGAPLLNGLQDQVTQALVNAGIGDTAAKLAGQLIAQGTAAGVGAAVSGGSVAGAAAAFGVDTNNRQLHETEKQRIQRLANGDAQKQYRLTAAACALVHCADGVPKDAPDYETLKSLQDAGASMLTEKTLLSQQKGWEGRTYQNLFQYGVIDTVLDAAQQNKIGTRLLGAAQGVAGSAGVVGSAVLCSSGLGCTLGAVSGTISADYAWAGTKQAVTGNSQVAYGEQGLQSLGLSPQAASLAYASMGLTPAAIETVITSKVVNAQAAANAWIRGTYTGTSASTYEGDIYRYTLPEFSAGTWNIYPSNVAANHRYSEPGVGALYTGTSVETAAKEVASYTSLEGKTLVAGNVIVRNVLDLTNPAARQALGVTLQDITTSSHGTGTSYDATQRISAWARDQGYGAILAPSAQNVAGAPNLISFNPLVPK